MTTLSVEIARNLGQAVDLDVVRLVAVLGQTGRIGGHEREAFHRRSRPRSPSGESRVNSTVQ